MQTRYSRLFARAAALVIALLMLGGIWSYTASAQSYRVLVFHKTTGFRHDSIDEGIAAIRKLGQDNGFAVDETQDASAFSTANLANYRVIIFLSTTTPKSPTEQQRLLNATQRAAFQSYIQGGGGWVGIHAASDAEYGWDWYGRLVGAFFDQHPAIQLADIDVVDSSHPSTAHLQATWTRSDEWYNFVPNPRSNNVNVLMTLDELSYSGGTMGDHPIAWYHLYDGGRAWYTALGHTAASFGEEDFLQHLLGGIQWAAERPAQATPSAAPTGAPSASASPSASPAPSPSPSAAPPSHRCWVPLTQK